MVRTRHTLAALILAASASAAFAASGVVVGKSAELKGKKLEDVVAKFGAFCSIEKWHPAVAKCEESKEGNDVFRTLTLKDGAKIKEKRTSQGEGTYGYKITESPLPVK
ncbi:MAG: SRPBCC family protein, partial [Hyphomicrobium sp.]